MSRCPACKQRLNHKWNKEAEMIPRAVVTDMASRVRDSLLQMKLALSQMKATVVHAQESMQADVSANLMLKSASTMQASGGTVTEGLLAAQEKVRLSLQNVQIEGKRVAANTQELLIQAERKCQDAQQAQAKPLSGFYFFSALHDLGELHESLVDPRDGNMPIEPDAQRSLALLTKIVASLSIEQSSAAVSNSLGEALTSCSDTINQMRLANQEVPLEVLETRASLERSVDILDLLTLDNVTVEPFLQAMWGATNSQCRLLGVTEAFLGHGSDRVSEVQDLSELVAHRVQQLRSSPGGGYANRLMVVAKSEMFLSLAYRRAALTLKSEFLHLTRIAATAAATTMQASIFSSSAQQKAAERTKDIDAMLRGTYAEPAVQPLPLNWSDATATTVRGSTPEIGTLSRPASRVVLSRGKMIATPSQTQTAATRKNKAEKPVQKCDVGMQVDVHGTTMRHTLAQFLKTASEALHHDILGRHPPLQDEVEMIKILPRVATILVTRLRDLHNTVQDLEHLLADKTTPVIARHPKPLALKRSALSSSEPLNSRSRTSSGPSFLLKTSKVHDSESIGAPFRRLV